MCSPMPPVPGMCCICWDQIPVGANAKDTDGDLWDVHQGKCAQDAGIEEWRQQ